MRLYWLDTGMFVGHYPHNHDHALEVAALALYSGEQKEAPYADCCFHGKIEVKSTEGCLGSIAGFIFEVTPSTEDRDQGARPARFLVSRRDLEANAFVN